MAESFNCPKCGAPMSYDADAQNNQETITCPYCSETVIVPETLRHKAPEHVFRVQDFPQAAVINISTSTSEYSQPVVAPRKSPRVLVGCLIFVAIFAAGAVIISFLAVNTAKNSIQQSLEGLNPGSISTPILIATRAVEAIQTQVALQVNEITATPEVKNKALFTPTPDLEQTATFEAQQTSIVESKSTLTALSAVVDTQKIWPLVVQEKFTNDQRNWTTGKDNNNLAVEDLSISGNKYTWKMTSKKSMGSFSFPDMPTLSSIFVSADVQMAATSGNSSDQAGIIFRHSQTDSSFYFFGVNPAGTYTLRMYDGSSWNDLIPLADTTLLKPNQVNHIAVSMQESQILLIINDALVASFDDSSLSEGTAGLGLYLDAPGEDVTFVFSNFNVRSPKK